MSQALQTRRRRLLAPRSPRAMRQRRCACCTPLCWRMRGSTSCTLAERCNATLVCAACMCGRLVNSRDAMLTSRRWRKKWQLGFWPNCAPPRPLLLPRVRFCHHGRIGLKADVQRARAPGPSPGAPALAAGGERRGGGLERAAGHPGCHGGWSNGALLAAHHHAAQACRCRCAWAGLCGPRTLWCGASGPPWLLARLGFGFVAARLLALALGAVGVALARPPRSAAFPSLPQRKIRSWVLRNRNSRLRPSCHRRR